MRVSINVTGDRDVRDSLSRLGKAGPVVAKRVLGAATARMVPLAKAGCPVDPEDGGELRDSIRTTRPNVNKNGKVSAGILAGGAPLLASLLAGHHNANIYAVIQEDDDTLHHAVGGAHFMRKAAFTVAPSVPGDIAKELDKEAR